MKWQRLFCMYGIICTCALLCPSSGLSSYEYKVKAAFVYKFLLFTDFPANSHKELPELPICIYGHDSSQGAFEFLEKATLNGHNLSVHYLKSTANQEQLQQCHVLFIGKHNSPDQTQRALKVVSGKAILSVGEQPGFLDWGGMIRIYKNQNRIAFSVNLTAADKVKIAFRSKMLRLANKVVHAGGQI